MIKLDLKSKDFWMSVAGIVVGVGSTVISNWQQKETIRKEVIKAVADQTKES